jgi:malate dehydrogenase
VHKDIWGLARVVRRHLSPETVGTRGAKFEEGCNGLLEPVRSDSETSSHEVDGQVSIFRREWRPVTAGTGSGPEGSRLTVDIRRPWGNGAEDECFGERRNVQSTDDASPFTITMSKVTIIGATGNVGMFASYAISANPHVREILLYGREGRETVLRGITQDFVDSFAARGTNLKISWTTNLKDAAGSDVVVITAGVPRSPGQDRLDLAMGNARIIAPLAQTVGVIAPETKILIVTNPVDVMTCVALKHSGLKPSQVFGLGTHLDSMRLKSLIAAYFKVHVSEVHTRIIGEHGESMVPLWSATTIGGIKISNLPAFAHLPVKEIIESVKCSGQLIIKDKGSTVYGPGEAIATLVKTILGDENRILTVSAYIQSEVHGIGEGDVCIGVPARINRNGVFPITIRIDESEVIAFRESVEKIRTNTRTVLSNLNE